MSKKLLHVDSSILGEYSVSRTLSAAIVAKMRAATPALEVTYRDLGAVAIPHLSGATAATFRGAPPPEDPVARADVALAATLMDEFLAADIVVLGVAFYNFTIASQLKAWIDRLMVAGKTFRYGEKGPVGLAGGKRVILAISRGGFYGPGNPTHSLEHAESYLRGVFAFMGITDIDVVAAEGISMGPAAREAAIGKAQEMITALAA